MFFCIECLVEDNATGQPRPRNYVQELERKIAHLQGVLSQAGPGHNVQQSSCNGEASCNLQTQTQANDLPLEYDTPRVSASPHEQEPPDKLSNDVAWLCVKTAGQDSEYLGPTSAVSLARVVSSAMKLPKGGGSAGYDEGIGSTRTHTVPAHRVNGITSAPASHRAMLATVYLENIHPQYPFLHWPTFEEWQNVSTETGFSESRAVPSFFLCMVGP
ncbi:unnamed protein product [Clonostachys rhizophaga]|uniref:Uncharacterized protein n=1 Tax=Clonostachys rhizophaga TaxID=160324 RepID=A0A9N9VD28_9HYPO|nr:unnamed protein product [Clonostachys rhizophaga]